MDKDKIGGLGYIFIAIAIIAGLIFFLSQIFKSDVSLVKEIFAGLVEARQPVRKLIDWEHLNALEVNVGEVYLKVRSQKEKLDFQKVFINNFSEGFKRMGGRLDAFTNWRLYDKDNEKVVVAADYPHYNKTILFTISKYGLSRLIGIQWEGVKSGAVK